MKLQEGKLAPDFSLEDKDGKRWTLGKLQHDFYVIYFYPKDSTPGCTIEANEFNVLEKEFTKINCKVIGISGGNSASKEKFCSNNNLHILLLSDSDHRVGKAYGVYGEKQFMGKKFEGYHRVTFVLDKNLTIVTVYGAVKAAGHAAQVLAFVKGLKK